MLTAFYALGALAGLWVLWIFFWGFVLGKSRTERFLEWILQCRVNEDITERFILNFCAGLIGLLLSAIVKVGDVVERKLHSLSAVLRR